MNTPESPRYIIRMRRGKPARFDYQILLWRRRKGPARLRAAVAQMKADFAWMLIEKSVPVVEWRPAFDQA